MNKENDLSKFFFINMTQVIELGGNKYGTTVETTFLKLNGKTIFFSVSFF